MSREANLYCLAIMAGAILVTYFMFKMIIGV